MVLITGSHSVAALEVIRCLGRRGIRAYTLRYEDKPELAGYSKYCKACHTLPATCGDDDVIARVNQILSDTGAESIIPCTDDLLFPLSRGRESLTARIMLPEEESLAIAADKARSVCLAKELGVPVPATWESISAEVPIPAVLKPRRSLTAGRRRMEVTYAFDRQQLEQKYQQMSDAGCEPVIQEFCIGTGEGIEVLARHGNIIAAGAHRRTREEDPRGSRSAAAVTIAPDRQLLHWTESLIGALQWDGPAMLEWKREQKGRIVFVEMNGRFWGTLPLAAPAGIDFAHLLYQLLNEEKPTETDVWKPGVRGGYAKAEWRWFKAALRGKPDGWPGSWPSRAQAFSGLTKSLCGHSFIWSLDDPVPLFRHYL